MKILLVRAFVFSLVATGVVASAQIAQRPSAVRLGTKISGIPVAVCPPDDPNACGMTGLGK